LKEKVLTPISLLIVRHIALDMEQFRLIKNADRNNWWCWLLFTGWVQ